MIYEFRTYDLQPRTLPQYQATLEKALSGGRLELSPLFAYLYSEFGKLNQALHIWPYESIEARFAIRAQSVEKENWPPATGELLNGQDAEIMFPAPFNDESITGEHGPFYELRTYTYGTNEVSKVIDAWSKAIDERRKHSPFIGAWYSELGKLNKWVHLWGYESLEQRSRVRAEMIERKIWPAPGGPAPRTQQSDLFLPFPFSPLK